MYNYVMLVGVAESFKAEKEDETILKIRINSEFKNLDGSRDSNLIPILLTDGLAFTVKESLGKMIAVKGRLKMIDNKLAVIGERIIQLRTEESVSSYNNRCIHYSTLTEDEFALLKEVL